MAREEIHAVYRLRVAAEDAPRRAHALALEQSIEMPAEAVLDAGLLERIAARVERIDALPDGSSLARIALASESVGTDPGQLLNMLFGNSSLLPDVELVDFDVPDTLARRFGGPALGIEGVRGLVGATGRPLTCTALKPIGSAPEQLAALCRTFAAAGIDVIKDDHGWADQAAAPFAQRVAACQAAVDEVNARRSGGQVTLYAPSLFGTCTQMLGQIELARSRGVRIALIAPMVCGVATLGGLRREHPDFAFIAHPSLAGAGRIAAAALLGKLFRLFGADATIFPNHGGRFAYPREVCLAIAQASRCDWHGFKPALPVPAGGMSVERVPELKREYGDDCMLLVGGSLLAARERLYERSREFVEAVAHTRAPADA